MSSQSPAYIDPRGPRFGAAVTSVVLAVVLITGSGWLLLAQAVVFAIGALSGLRFAPYGLLYRALVRPRLSKPTELEHPAPPTFAQTVGFFFVAVGVIGYLAGLPVLGIVFTALALAAAFLNAAFEYCVGCEMYLLFRRSTVRHRPVGP
jgi:uncharacterized protein DUF4395